MSRSVNDVVIKEASEVNSNAFDAVILIKAHGLPVVQALEQFVDSLAKVDDGVDKVPSVAHCPLVSGNRLVISPTGPITPYDDVRSLSEATKRGVERAIDAGAKKPLVVVQHYGAFENSELVVALAALEALYVPLQLRELSPEKRRRVEALGFYGEGVKCSMSQLLDTAVALETSLAVGRDIMGGDPERMSPIKVVEYVQETFKNTSVKVRVVDDVATFEREYPLYAAVNRAANAVPRHRGRIIFLEYSPGDHQQTLMLVGKGVSYDTGGADVKAGGHMAGMSRDKGGAAALAALLKACDLLKPKLKVMAVMSMVRNSIGEESYVADELIKCRNGKLVRVGNTDAEGRMIMADLLAEMKEKAANEKSPHIYTIATLTGHAHRAVGTGYTIVMDNHVARKSNHDLAFQKAGSSVGDMVEVSTIRREDLAIHRGQSTGDDVHQALNLPSTQVPRGHQGPAGFLLLTSGLNEGSVPYSHLDIAASGGSLPDPPTSAPVLALANLYNMIKV